VNRHPQLLIEIVLEHRRTRGIEVAVGMLGDLFVPHDFELIAP
jgi:hypothetical protein